MLNDLLTRSGLPHKLEVDTPIKGLSYDSRHVKPGDLYFAIPGVHADGHSFLSQAASKGAQAAVVEKPVTSPIPTIQVSSVLAAMSKLAHIFYGKPSAKIPVIGVTGTNGKTTTTYLIESLYRSQSQTCGVMGTVNYRIGSSIWPAPNTTPMSMDVHKFIQQCIENGASATVMEVSSHALELNRVDTVQFSIGVFTNLTQDHLDFHKTMENYYQAKARLFKRREPVKAAVNIDDPYGKRLFGELKSAVSFGFDANAMLRVENAKFNLSGVQFDLIFPSKVKFHIANNLLGQHNIQNCLSAAGALYLAGFPDEKIAQGLNASHSIPGRLERVEAGQDYVVVVDYAHTPDALEQVLKTLRDTGPKKLICVFGAGGDRDKTKRPKMGAIAANLSDHVVVTSDNPRSENPTAILSDIEVGIRNEKKNNYEMIENRNEAIQKAIHLAAKGDIVLIAGKGHENYQIIGTTKHPYSDFEVAKKAIAS